MATFRQPNGLSATLVNTPALTGPFTNMTGAACSTITNTGTTGPASAGASDGGTGSILGSPQVPPGVLANCTTLGTAGGVFSYGFAPEDAGTSGAAVFGLYAQPFYNNSGLANPQYNGSTTGRVYKCGPPACPLPLLAAGGSPSALTFSGFTEGFTTFGLTPVLGTYNLSVGIQNSTGQTTTISAPAATMASLVGLPAYPTPLISSKNGIGGMVISITPPAGVTESIVNVTNLSFNPTGSGCTSATSTSTPGCPVLTVVVQGAAPALVTIPNSFVNQLGQTLQSFNTGDTFRITVVGVNYPAYESGPGAGNTNQTPVIVGANGQCDITFSSEVQSVY